jgi:hypothetical protein
VRVFATFGKIGDGGRIRPAQLLDGLRILDVVAEGTDTQVAAAY